MAEHRRSVGLVACGKRKQDHPAPAAELYCGDLFRKACAYARFAYDDWFILSAKHGLVPPDTILAPYDLSLRHLNARERREWADRVLAQTSRNLWRSRGDRLLSPRRRPVR